MADLHRVIKVGILTVSDTCYNGKAEDKSGENLKSLVESGKCFKGTVTTKDIIHDVEKDIKVKLLHWSDSLKLDVILTTGGTGFSPRDVTPEATKAIIEKEALGMAVAMIKGSLDITPLAMLSRLVCGIRGNTLIINLPGSTKGSAECLQIVAKSIPHAVDLLHSENSNVERTHSTLQAEGIKWVNSNRSVHSSDADADVDNLSFRGCENVKSKISSSPNLMKHLEDDEKQQSTFRKESLTQICNKLMENLDQLVKGVTPSNFNLIECHINDGLNVENHWMNLMTKFIQVLLFVIEDFTRSLGIADQHTSASISSQISKAIESKMKSWIDSCRPEPYDQHFLSSPPFPSDNKFLNRRLGCNVETDSIKPFVSEEVYRHSKNIFVHPPTSVFPSYQSEPRVSKSSSHPGNSQGMKKHTPCSFDNDFYIKKSESQNQSFSVPNSYKLFHQNSLENSKMTDYSKNRNLTYLSHSPLSSHIVSKKAKGLHECATKPGQIDLKRTPENFLLKDDNEYIYPPNSNLETKEEQKMSILLNNKSRISDFSKQCSNENLRLRGEHAIYGSSDMSYNHEKNQNWDENICKPRYNEMIGLDNHTCSPNAIMKKYNFSPISTSATNSSRPVLSSSSKPPLENSLPIITAPKPQTSSECKIHLQSNIMSAKIHNVNNQGELVNVAVGKAFNCFVNDHRLLKGISLYKGKRDIKKLLVYMSRQEDVIGQATSWKRGKEVLERNRFDDYFQLTPEGMEEQQQVLSGRKRDQYVVNWYMWCPGHGNCKRKCGGFGNCIENCKGMLHKQDRHNCSLMVNLKLFLSDLSTWRVHITGSHLPEQVEVNTAVSTSSQNDAQSQINPCLKDSSKSSISYTLDNSNLNVNRGQISSKATSVVSESEVASVENPFLSNVSNAFYDNDHEMQQSKMPSKKRISKMLSSLKRRRQNKPYGLLKSRLTNSNSTCENGNGASKVSFPKNYDDNLNLEKHSMSDNATANAANSGMVSETTLTMPTPYNQSSLLNELSSYLPVDCTNEDNQVAGSVLKSESLARMGISKSVSVVTKLTSETIPVPYTCHTATTTKYTDSLTDYIATHHELPLNLETTDMPQEDVDIYHSAISLPNFHQPFLHANSLTDILTEAGVNISEQFDDLNSSINIGNDSAALTGMDHTEESISESFLPFQPSHQVIPRPSSSLLADESSNIMISNSHLTNLRINVTCEKSTESSLHS